ncbi:MAG: DUF433 domain-containing protein [Beijerinckiaceae bacterium]
MKHERISINPRIMSGAACIAGTRVPVDLILRYIGAGWTIEDFEREYPQLKSEDVRAAAAYAADQLSGWTMQEVA